MTAEQARGHRRRLRRDPGGEVGRRVPPGGMADRQRHPDQHERQRGHCPPGRRNTGVVLHPNDHVNRFPVQQRHLSLRAAHCRSAGVWSRMCCPPRSGWQASFAALEDEIPGSDPHWPHPSAGRHAPEIRRRRSPAGGSWWRPPAGCCEQSPAGAAEAGHRRHRRGHRPQRPRGLRSRRSAPHLTKLTGVDV